jgi:uncharacterized protein with HEPN domain
MPSDAHEAALLDIRHHIGLAFQLIEGYDEAGFVADVRTLYAVVRCLEIISEASRRLPDDLKVRHSGIAWRNIAAAGNVYRHACQHVSPKQVWETVQSALAPLQDAIATELLGRDEGMPHDG